MSIKRLYNPKLIIHSKTLRKDSTPAERKMWGYLRGKRFMGYKFKRQQAFLNYVLDFYCPELKLAIEIDGATHDDRKYNYDKLRQKHLEAIDIFFLRFTEHQVKNDIHSVLQTIENFVEGIKPTDD